MEARGAIAYDRYGEEMRISEERVESNSTREFYDTLYLFGQVRIHACTAMIQYNTYLHSWINY